MKGVNSNDGSVALLADITAGALAAATLHLFVDDVDPGRDCDETDFTEATFTGGTAKAIGTYGQAHLDPNGDIKQQAPSLQWDWTAGGPETVYGVYAMTAGGSPAFIGYQRFDDPVVMADALDSLVLTPGFVLSDTGARLSCDQAL